MIMIIIFSFITYLLSVNASAPTYEVLAGGPFGLTKRVELFQHILRFKSWPNIARNKKHKAVSTCRDVPNNLSSFRKTWKDVSGIYKITFLPFRMFTYFGSSSNLGLRFKYHYFNGSKQKNFLGLFLLIFG